MGGWKPDSSEEAQWEKLTRFVQLYSWLTIGGVLFGVALAHKVLFTGQSWTTCAGKVGCVLTFHLMEVPLVVYLVVVAIYGLGYLSRATLHRFYALLSFANVVALVFGVFEIIVLLNGFERHPPTFELVALALAASVLLFGAGLGLALLVRLNTIFYPIQDPRYVHPTTEKELVTLVQKAQSEGLALRVRGSAHSVYRAIYTDESPPGNINVQLDRYNRILHWDTARKRVTVQAGCHLGVDPRDPRSNRKPGRSWCRLSLIYTRMPVRRDLARKSFCSMVSIPVPGGAIMSSSVALRQRIAQFSGALTSSGSTIRPCPICSPDCL
jgi:hypothetical protein